MIAIVRTGLDGRLTQARALARHWLHAEKREFDLAARLVEAGILLVETGRKSPRAWADMVEAVEPRRGMASLAGEYSAAAKLILGVDAERSKISRYSYAMALVADLIDQKLIDRSEILDTVIENGGMIGCAMAFRLPRPSQGRSRYLRWLDRLSENRLGYISDPQIEIDGESLALVRKRGSRLEVVLISDRPDALKKAVRIEPVVVE